MALKIPYATVEEADVFLVGSTDWEAATVEQKEDALVWGRYYMDSTFICPNLDESDPSEEIKYANSLCGEDYLQGTLLNADGTKTPTIRQERVKAGSVESETEYAYAYGSNPQQDVDSLLFEQCSKQTGTTSFLMRS